ncbi:MULTISPECIES: hypothetical protein [unclassified Frankia]|uniref:hypothetical protein n=1 Tax=unclassified Frankia TaxID=2632575 RepID=UPI002AD1E7D4|nr:MULTISPECIES: hypothetical protein [unclassified Frankia]
MTTHYLYGTQRSDIENLAAEFADALKIEPEARESSYIGFYYEFYSDHIRGSLKPNKYADFEDEEDDDGYHRPDRKDISLLFQVAIDMETEEFDRIVHNITGIALLKKNISK